MMNGWKDSTRFSNDNGNWVFGWVCDFVHHIERSCLSHWCGGVCRLFVAVHLSAIMVDPTCHPQSIYQWMSRACWLIVDSWILPSNSMSSHYNACLKNSLVWLSIQILVHRVISGASCRGCLVEVMPSLCHSFDLTVPMRPKCSILYFHSYLAHTHVWWNSLH